MLNYFYVVVLAVLFASSLAGGSHAGVVTFDESGVAQVDGKPFFPIGLFTYELNTTVMAEIHELQFNTILHGFNPDQLDYIKQHGLMAVCYNSDAFFNVAKDHPALLAWYLTDEPESHSKNPASEKERYLALKQNDPNHPIGLCHYLFTSLSEYKECCDFTMTDVYPITAQRDVPILNVGVHIDEARRVHGPNWPNWAYIQDFGGPDTDGGKWAQPLPHEVRCMAYIALAHRATGILYFSYWADKAPRTWQSIAPLNRELHTLIPWLVAKGTELTPTCSVPEIHVRARKTDNGGVLIAVNTSPLFASPEIVIPSGPKKEIRGFTDGRSRTLEKGRLRETFGPFEAKVFVWGDEPKVELAQTKN